MLGLFSSLFHYLDEFPRMSRFLFGSGTDVVTYGRRRLLRPHRSDRKKKGSRAKAQRRAKAKRRRSRKR